MASRKQPLDYYEVLGLPRTASSAEIETAFRAETLKYRDLPGGSEQTRRVNLAYRALSNPDRRRDYDASLGGSRPVPPPEVGGNGEEASFGDAYPAQPPPAQESDEQWYEDEPRPRRKGLMLASVAALLLLLAAGLWAGGMFEPGPKLAENAPSQTGTVEGGQPAAPGTQKESRGGLADAFASLLPNRGEPESEPLPAPGDPAQEPPAPSTEVAAAENGTGAAAADPAPEAPVAAAAEEPTPAASPPAEAEATPRAEPPREQPAPPPAVDRSAPARLASGGLVDADNLGGRFQGTVGVRVRVGLNGRAQSCRVTRSSGNAVLDATTCRLLQQRLQFTPARDREGNPISVEVDSTHVWTRQPRRR